MEFKKGESREQIILFPDSLEEYVDENNAVRVIEAYINSLDLEELGFSRFEPQETGRPAYDPKDMLKLYLYGYLNRIRSSRLLETESKRNLELIWLLRKLSPDHKTIARFRSDNAKALKNVFRDFIKLCVRLGLYGKELLSIDGSKFKAVNAKSRNFTNEKLKKRLKELDEKIEKYLSELDNADEEEAGVLKEPTAEEISSVIKSLKERKSRYEGYEKELEESGEKQLSLTDSESRRMPCNGKMDVCYNVQTAVDAKNKLIVEYEVTNKSNDLNQLTPLSVKAQEILETERIAVTADTGYDSAPDICAAIRAGVDVHIAGTDYDICVPVAEEEAAEISSHRSGRSVYIPERNVAVCPMGKVLYPAYYNKSKRQSVYHNSQACKSCSCRCTSSTHYLRYSIVMERADFTKDYNDEGLAVKQVRIKPDKEVYRQRKSLSEHPFGTIKRAMDGGYCLTKGKHKVGGEFALMFLAYNLKCVINILGSKELIQRMSYPVCPA